MVQDAEGQGDGVAGRDRDAGSIWELFALATPFCCKPKTALKNSVLIFF